MNPPVQLHAGDTLLYSKSDFFGWITSLRTWSPAVHVEKYDGAGMSLASRNGIGVNRYLLRIPQLCAVLRPNQPVNLKAVKEWFEVKFMFGKGVRGRPYGWLDLLRFYSVKVPTSGWICSEFAAKWDAVAGLKSFASDYNTGAIDPGDFFISPAYDWVWVRPDTRKALEQ